MRSLLGGIMVRLVAREMTLIQKLWQSGWRVLLLSLCVSQLPNKLFAGVAANQTPVTIPDLETRVWNGDESTLSKLETEIVRILQKDPSSTFAHYLLAHLYVRRFSQTPGEMQVLKAASEIAEQAVELDPTSDLGYLAMADILDLMGQTSKAVSLLTAAGKSGLEKSWRFHFHMARLQLDVLTKEEALKQFENSMKSADVRGEIVVPYIIALIQANAQGKPLVAELEKWEKRFPSPLFRQTIAANLSDIGSFQAAHQMYQKLQHQNPEVKEAWVNDAILLYRHLGNAKDGIAILENVLNTRSGEFETQSLSMMKAHLGSAYLQVKQIDKAKKTYIEAFRHTGNNIALLDFINSAFKQNKQFASFVDLMEKLNREDKGVGHAYALMGQTLSENLNEQNAAIKAYKNAITLEPQRADFYTGMGLAYYRLNSFKEALNQFEAAGRIDPNDATAKYNQACVLARLGKTDDALASLQEALNLDPKLQNTAKSDLDFAGLAQNTQFRSLVDRGPAIEDTAIAH